MTKEKDINDYLIAIDAFNSSNLEQILTRTDFVNKICERKNEMILSANTIFESCKTRNKIKFFNKNINLFENADHAVILFGKIIDEFELESRVAFNCVIEIFKNENCHKNLIENIYQMLENFTTLDKIQICKIIANCPHFLCVDFNKYYNTLSTLSSKFKVSKTTFTHIFTNCPLFFAKNSILPTINIFSKMLSLSPYELNYFLESNYQIFLSPITKLKDNLSSLIHIFQLDDSDTTGIILSCPQLLTIPKSNLYSFTQTIMRTFSYPNPELDRILFTTPSLATYDNAKLLHQCKMLSSCNIFVKRDLKEILLSSPTILSLTQDELISNILNLARLFKLSSEKQILEFVRLCPRAIAVRDIYRKLKLLDEYSIKLAHIVYSPSILKSQTILSAIKFLILKSVHQEYCIDSIIDMSIDELVSKLKFLHNINSSVNDISLCNELFENKYHITTSKLLKKYKTSPHELKQLFVAAFGNNLKFNKFKTFFDTNYTEQMRIALSKIQCNSNTLKNKKSIAKILQILGIDIWDCESIANLLYKNVIAQRVLENIELLKKHEIPRDHIIEIITKKPILLASSTKRLNDKLNNLKNDYSYNIIKFYENI